MMQKMVVAYTAISPSLGEWSIGRALSMLVLAFDDDYYPEKHLMTW
jgi:hypothetical protein